MATDLAKTLRKDGFLNEEMSLHAIETISEVLKVPVSAIKDIEISKKGMTNRSFLFTVNGKRYMMRIPGEGTDKLINRAQEAAVYKVLQGSNLCDRIDYINPENGYKISEYLFGARNCDPFREQDVKTCMMRLRQFHQQAIRVDHIFDIFGQIDFYESLWSDKKSAYPNYEELKDRIFSLKGYIDKHASSFVLTHIDAVPDNFLFVADRLYLIDWEYAGMQDPDVDLAMFCLYAMYDREHVEKLINAYYTEGCEEKRHTKIYCYIAACGLLWSNWCEFKRALGVEFGEYALNQYSLAEQYCTLAENRIKSEK